jgi:hypothetical protein
MSERTKVFISYSHDSPEHVKRVLDLADALRDGGLDVMLDQYVHPAPDEGWPRWMDTQVDTANFIVMVCTETYRRRVMGREEPGKGFGVRWEGNLVYNRIYNDQPSGSRFIPVLLDGSEPAQIPNPVQGHSYYRIGRFERSDAGYEGLYRHLTGQAPTPPREIGALHLLPPSPRRVPPDPRNRSKMLQKVRTIWITGFLQKSLFQEVRIMLGLSERLDVVERPMDVLVRRPDQGERPLTPGTRLVDFYDEMDRTLLILGDPGSGKTTLLLELARDLLDRAAQDPEHLIPVVFPLSTWAQTRKPLADWLVDELDLRYDVRRELGQAWVQADQILPLLDGLDEVEAERRDACVEAINAYRRDHGFVSLVVCSRTGDYEALVRPLRLHGAIVVQPLTPQQVESYLAQIGSTGETVRRAAGADKSVWELLDSPLMLNIVTVVYAGQPQLQPPVSGTLMERRDDLFEAYVDQMFQRRGVKSGYTPAQTVHWLMWLADQMVSHNQTVFYLEHLRLDWLPQSARLTAQKSNKLLSGLFSGMVLGLAMGLVVGIHAYLLFGISVGLYSWMFCWLFTGLGFGAIDWMIADFKEMDNSVGLYFVDWEHMTPSPIFIKISCILAAVISGAVYGLVVGLVIGLGRGLVGGLIGALEGCLVGGMVLVLVVLGFELVTAGRANIRRYVLRFFLKRNGSAPWNYVKFLDYAAGRILLRKVGGGYAFLHRMLLEYFAARYVDPGSTTANAANPSLIDTEL